MKFRDMPPEKQQVVRMLLRSMVTDCESINESLNKVSALLPTSGLDDE